VNIGTCIHYTGVLLPGNPREHCCLAGVNYWTAFDGDKPGMVLRIPCVQFHERPKNRPGTVINAGDETILVEVDRKGQYVSPCEHLHLPTRAEVSAQREADWIDMKDRLKHLRVIGIAMHGLDGKSRGPRFGYAVSIGIMVFVATTGAWYAADNAGLLVWSAYSPWAAWVLGVGAFVWVNNKSRYYKTWIDLISATLAEYDPVDKDAYRHLQQRTQKAGFLDLLHVREWITAEHHAVEVAKALSVKGNRHA